MKQDIKTLSNNITELVNRFVEIATSQIQAGGVPVHVSLMDAAPADMSEHDINQYIQFIVEELSSRPELTEISFPRTPEEIKIAEKTGPFTLVVGCDPRYCKNLFDIGLGEPLGYIAPEHRLSLARKAEITDNAILYVQETSQNVQEDLTERLGFSMDELNSMGLLIPEFQPLRIDYVITNTDPVTGNMQLASYATIEEALDGWAGGEDSQIYAETEFGSICLVKNHDVFGSQVCLSLPASLFEAGLLSEDLPDALLENLKMALNVLADHFPKEQGLPSKLTLENAIGQTMYYSEHCFYGEILNMEPVLCTGFKPGVEEHLDQIRIQREVADARGNLHELKHILLRSQILLNREDVMSEAVAAHNWINREGKFSMLGVSKNIETGHIFVIPLENQRDEFDGTSKLRRWALEYSIDGRAPMPGESLTKDGYQVFFFNIEDLDSAVDKTIELMRPHVSEIQHTKSVYRLHDLLSGAIKQAEAHSPKPEQKHYSQTSLASAER